MKTECDEAMRQIVAQTPAHLDNVKAIRAYIDSLEVPVVTELAPVVAEPVVVESPPEVPVE